MAFREKRFLASAGLPAAIVWTLAALVGVSGCKRDAQPTVVVYSSLDSQFAEPILDDFEKQTGIRVRPRFDTESTKTVGLTEAIINESRAGSARCDVFWNNEILNTLRLQRRGLLDAYVSPSHASYPALYRSPSKTWHGFAARARVLIVNTQRVPDDGRPESILDLAEPQWKGKAGIGKPLFGTTATHAACLFSVWGPEKAKAYFRSLKENDIAIEAGNKQVALRVASGQLAFGLTDTDDAIIEVEKGMPVTIVYPDSQEGQLGTLFIPNTLAVIKGAAHGKEARALIDYLLSPQVETRLAEGPSAQIPLNPNVRAKVRVKTPDQMHAMQVDFEQAAEQWKQTADYLRREFLAP